MKNLSFFFGFALTLLTIQNTSAQDVQLATYSNTTSIEVLVGGIGEKTNSGAQIVSAMQEGVAITKLNDKFGLVNAQGFEILSPRFEAIHPFQNGYAAAKLHGKWSFINKQGKKIAAFHYDWVGNFTEGAAPIQINGKWGFINEQGAPICEAEFDMVRSFDNGIALVRKGDNWFQLSIQGILLPIEGTAKLASKTQI